MFPISAQQQRWAMLCIVFSMESKGGGAMVKIQEFRNGTKKIQKELLNAIKKGKLYQRH